ncbi:MAG TPA: hypothetical protein VK788_03505 [Terriglobales bacterium]|nr:hypothetical protein [Terriglobales bacterium]
MKRVIAATIAALWEARDIYFLSFLVLLFAPMVFAQQPDQTDVRQYGVRGINASVAPATPGLTANCTSGSAALPVSAANMFINGDGVIVIGCGLANNVTVPIGLTVTPSVASGPTGTGLVVPAPLGSTTYCYAIIARDKPGGLSAASPQVCTSTGSALLGPQSVPISGWTRSGTTVTASTSEPHGLASGSWVYMYSTLPDVADNLNFGGWFTVAVSDTTHFTYETGQDAASGASIVSIGGGSANWWNANHLAWTSQPNAFENYAYGRTSASMNLIGVSKVQSVINGLTPDTTWDDFGSPVMDGVLLPYFVPSIPPSSALADPLVTTIVSGANSPTLTLANAPSTTVSGASILFDNTPNIQTAASQAKFHSLLYFPANPNGYSYVVNSYLSIPTFVSISLAGSALYLNDTMEVGGGDKIFGMLGAQGGSALTFAWPVGGSIWANRANPGIYGPYGYLYFYGIQLDAPNGGSAMVLDNAANSSFNFVNFAGGSTDYMTIPLIVRAADFLVDFNHVAVIVGPGQRNGISSTPALSYSGGDVIFSNMTLNRRGIFKYSPNGGPGEDVVFSGNNRLQGGIMPFFTLYNGAGAEGGSISFHGVELDTMNHALFANASSGAYVGSVTVQGGSGPSWGFGFLTGKPVGSCSGSCSGQNIRVISNSNFTSNRVTVNGIGAVGYTMPPPSAPILTLSSGGNAQVGTTLYYATAVDANGSETPQSTPTQIIVTAGNQTVAIKAPTLPLGAVGWKPYKGGPGRGSQLVNFGDCRDGAFFLPGVDAVDPYGFTCGDGTPNSGASSAGLGTAGVFGRALALTPVPFLKLGTPQNGVIKFCPDCAFWTRPCMGGGTGSYARGLNGQWICM